MRGNLAAIIVAAGIGAIPVLGADLGFPQGAPGPFWQIWAWAVLSGLVGTPFARIVRNALK